MTLAYLLAFGVSICFLLLGLAVFKNASEIKRLRDHVDEVDRRGRERSSTLHAALANLRRPILRRRELQTILQAISESPDDEMLRNRLKKRGDNSPPAHG